MSDQMWVVMVTTVTLSAVVGACTAEEQLVMQAQLPVVSGAGPLLQYASMQDHNAAEGAAAAAADAQQLM